MSLVLSFPFTIVSFFLSVVHFKSSNCSYSLQSQYNNGKSKTSWSRHYNCSCIEKSQKVTQTYLADFYFPGTLLSCNCSHLPLHLPYTGSLDIQQLVWDCWLSSGHQSGWFSHYLTVHPRGSMLSFTCPRVLCRRSLLWPNAVWIGVNCLDGMAECWIC